MKGKYLPQNILYQAPRHKLQNNLKFTRNLCVGYSTGGSGYYVFELAPNMWLRMGLDNTKMADNV